MPTRRIPFHPILALFLATVVSPSCGPPGGPGTDADAGPEPFRVLVRSQPIAFLPRNADPVELDREIAEGLAQSLGRPLELVLADDYSSLLDRLLDGEADLAAASLTATSARRERVDFSLPYLTVDELLVRPADAPAAESPEELDGLEVGVRRSSSYAETLLDLRERVPGLRIRWMPETDDVEDILERVAEGEIEATLVDSHIWSAVGGHFETLAASLPVAVNRPIALALRPGDEDLRRKANEYLIARALTGPRPEVSFADLPELEKRGRLRMITRNHPATYFLHRGEQLGFEYELLERFARERDLRLEIVIPPTRADLEKWLLEGRGDVMAASLAITADDSSAVAFTRRFATVERVVAMRADEVPGILGPEDLAGRVLHVPGTEADVARIRELLGDEAEVVVEAAPPDLGAEELLALVEKGVYDAIVCATPQLDVARNAGRELAAAFPLGEIDLGWAVRSENEELRRELDRYLRREYRGLHYNLAWARYFGESASRTGSEDAFRSDLTGRISRWDDIARRHAAAYDLDWRLLVAQMYQESRFDPDRVSFAGAAGLMQIIPRTARELGVGDRRDPEASIAGGAKYMRWLIDRTDPKLPLATRIRFALASYNAGRGHLLDARRLAGKLGLDPDRWEGNVEKAMLLLERWEYFEQARFGYCRGSECVRYVREVDRRYRLWVAQVPERVTYDGEGAFTPTLARPLPTELARADESEAEPAGI
jgi:membrane-bound lytic murein transglycosylase F